MKYDNPPPVFTPFLRRFTDERARDLSETIALYHEVHAAHMASPFAAADIVDRAHSFIAECAADIVALPQSKPILQALDRCQTSVLALETTLFSFPVIDWSGAHLSLKEQVDLRRFLRAKQHFLANQDRVLQMLAIAVGNVFAGLIHEMPAVPDEDAGLFSVPLLSLLPDPGGLVDRIIGTLTAQELVDAGLFTSLQERFYLNVCAASGIAPHAESKRPYITADRSDLPPEELVNTYLHGTPFKDLFFAPIPFALPERTRFEHHWIVGGTGHGKTTALLALISRDLELVERGEASLIVIESQNQIIPKLSHLEFFSRHPDKLCLIDPTDIEYPVQLNLFSLGTERLDSYSMLDREQLFNSIIELYDFVLTSLLGAEMTSKQSTLFSYVTLALLHIPNATIHTLRELMEPQGYDKFKQHLDGLEGTARAFFETEFNSNQFADTKRQVVRRLYGILKTRAFERMFSHPVSKLDMFEEMNSGKVILINTAKDLLKREGTEIFGRFFIALIAQAAAERGTPGAKRLPCFVYIDECQEYIGKDANIASILEQGRKNNVALILAHQYLSQLDQRILDNLYADTSIKFAGGVSDKDAHALARNMRTTPEFILGQRKGSFSAFVRNYTDNAVALRIPFGLLDRKEHMSSEQFSRLCDHMRARYAIPYKDLQHRAKVSASSTAEPEEFADRY